MAYKCYDDTRVFFIVHMYWCFLCMHKHLILQGFGLIRFLTVAWQKDDSWLNDAMRYTAGMIFFTGTHLKSLSMENLG